MNDHQRLDRLTDRVRTVMGDPRLAVRPWRMGVDFWADLVEADRIVGVLRSPRHELLDTTYEGLVDFGDVLDKEAEALRLMAAAAIPVPEVLARYRASCPGDSSWILLSYVPHEDSPALPTGRLGQLARRLHEIRSPRLPGAAPADSWAAFVWDRLRQRLAAARPYCQLPEPADLAAPLIRLLAPREAHADRLLHMDLRADNICVRGTDIVALIDVANCIVGDPLLELARIRAYGLLDRDFLAGYGLDLATLAPDELTLLDVYELDTTALLTVVAVEEIHDPTLHRTQATRTEQLAGRIAERLSAC